VARKYELRKRAERMAETRRRIVDAAVDLHGTVGPARTTLSAIAERAGVQRHTLYAHFPTEADLFAACSGDWMARHAPPDPAGWRDVADPWQRLRRGLEELYGWYGANAAMVGNVVRDAEAHELTREVFRSSMGPWARAAFAVLGEGLGDGPARRALLGLAISFTTWRSLVQEGGLDAPRAAAVMATAVRCAEDGSPA
jgi:AcrR family transcriptional regulator